jgi:large subunit ribosomal protein L21
MYAVIRAGGKQQKVQPGDIIEIELVHGEGDSITFTPLLVVDDEGATHAGKEAERAVVTAKLLGEQKGEKVHVFKYKNKSGYARHTGHRQTMTLVEIADVKLGSSRSKAKAAAAKDDDAATDGEGAAETEAETETEAEARARPGW